METRNKIVVFSQFNRVLEFYAALFDCSIITGKSTRKQRKHNLEQFKTGKCKMFCLSTKVANVGLNLEEGDTLVFVEPGLDQADEEQAIGRLQRIGQQKSIEIHNLFTSDTVEENVRARRYQYNFQRGSQVEKKASFLSYAYNLVH
tara:strand:+ start:391 stop:828 length:438 start_codon:yes stop_codon:yes gene_type:complete